jgi:hypothetical protein
MRRVNIFTLLFHPNFNPRLEKFKIFVLGDLKYFKEFIFSLTLMTCHLPVHCLGYFIPFVKIAKKKKKTQV